MFSSVGASSNPLSYLQSLTQGAFGAGDAAASSDDAAANNPLSPLLQALSGFGRATEQPTLATAPASVTAGSGTSPFDAGTMAALLSLQDQSAGGASGQNGIASVSLPPSATGATAQIDTNPDGSTTTTVSYADAGTAAMTPSSAPVTSGDTPASGATAQVDTNPDGSTSTTISYTDVNTVATPTPLAPMGSSGVATATHSTANLFDQLIQLQSRMLGTVTLPTLSAFI